ncbi:MAG TPA: phosphoadenylyl-sulfate reductase [Marinilabiliales bacterium]|nr:MAG: phosphoadenosine phosphosulfate reductase [Bacteroidetes bacterium GWA2_40_14]OFX76185.1 MAG: phosphoadenosine phosphosulfate reductase [Bacteroidetes bacterium GWD2_40_43]OFX95366.1 MAG: phosphoadenosine phosphosulfate reductase [Bacteroidetes bacterium GWE2_40_63]OFY19029.1 MAG: phosphoadenosine phosphosulfate reductase [Bacteroidetes bacterium GWF2_40_13]OFZ23989.1 MAG: phosphoadenosine phosphosulfate reductase [Bacteroidetes bacterium RIFOXYC2_FULL_40_12]HAN00152.1 phosphoadenylyl-
MLQTKIDRFNDKVQSLDTLGALRFLANEANGKIVFTTSFGYEDQVITDLIFRNNLPFEVVTLDTGRLFKETYKVYSQTLDTYKKPIKVYFPQATSVEEMMTAKGPFSFYDSTANRQECCHIRKVEPLNRALQGVGFWITGIRAEQSPNRQGMTYFELDSHRQIIKFNPLLHWTLEQVIQYIKDNHVPYNVLHDKGFVSIGCEPCTRAIQPGEDFRAGRWWWENNSKKECGLHSK